MSWLGKLFGTDKAYDDILDKDKGLLVRAGGWIDDFHYTEQEKAEAIKEKREYGLKLLEALHPFKVVQRVLAFSTMGMWLFLGLNIIVAIWVEAFTGVDVRGHFIALATTSFMVYPIVSVFSLYTAGGVLPEWIRGKKKPTK